MNVHELKILNELNKESFVNQRLLAQKSDYSLGIVNKSLKKLFDNGYIDKNYKITEKAKNEFHNKAPKNAIILAAGYGMRMVPINTAVPKGLLEVNGEPLIERIIKQLHERKIKDITIIVGFMKEQFEYLIDEYDVKLVVNTEYSSKNNLHSMKLVCDKLSNTYVIPCDIWCEQNPFRENELYSWYMVSDMVDDNSTVRVNRKMELVRVSENEAGNEMIGIAYLLEEHASRVRELINDLCRDTKNDGEFWEISLFEKDRMIIPAKVVRSSDTVEINTYEQLRELDNKSNQLKSDAIDIIVDTLACRADDVVDIQVLKKGMTNRSFLFTCKGEKYIMRIPGEGTDLLINRKEEANVYKTICEKTICDDIKYINSKNGYKISKYFENARVCNPYNVEDITKCMKKLREMHQFKLVVDHEFNLFEQIEFYESLWNGQPSIYRDYKKTKEDIYSLSEYIQKYQEKKVLTHIDAVPDNFLFVGEEIRLIDWEYAGMQDPHVDIAMFCIYAMYDKEQVDQLIDLYFTEGCSKEVRIKIYCYIAVCGLLWSNWCEYKRQLGIEFGEYSIRQYRYAKEYYKIAREEMQTGGDEL